MLLTDSDNRHPLPPPGRFIPVTFTNTLLLMGRPGILPPFKPNSQGPGRDPWLSSDQRGDLA
jgi:hypothetical protein